jgi:predicted hydrolase (HD superfamily)
VDAPSVLKKMKKKEFARGVNRDDVILGAQELGIELETHVQFVITAMRGAADAIGLAGTPGNAPPRAEESLH